MEAEALAGSVQELEHIVQKHFIISHGSCYKPTRNQRSNAVESKKLIIAFVWTFVLAAIVIVSLEGGGMTFAGYFIFFFIALASTMAVETMIPDKK